MLKKIGFIVHFPVHPAKILNADLRILIGGLASPAYICNTKTTFPPNNEQL